MSALIDAAILILTGGNTQFKDCGKNVIYGFIEGVKETFGEAKKTISAFGEATLDRLKKVLGIHSPSTEFAELGMYSAKGFANGLTRFAGVAMTAAKDVGTNTMNSLKGAVSKMADVVSGDVDLNPTIRPVLDYRCRVWYEPDRFSVKPEPRNQCEWCQ
jgi:hypothetical protein